MSEVNLPEVETTIQPDLNPDEIISLVTNERLKLIGSIGSMVDSDKLKLLADTAKTAMDQKKLKVATETKESIDDLAAALYRQMALEGNNDPFKGLQSNETPARAPLSIDDSLLGDTDVSDPELLSVDPEPLSYDKMFGDDE